MKRRNLGSLHVPEMGLGCMGMSAFYGTTDEGEALATIDRALELGCNFLDTAEMYGPFKNEELVGKAIAGRRDEFVVATKWGIRFAPTEDNPTNRVLDGSPENARNSIEGSLQRLGTDHVDLYYLHRVDPNSADRGDGRRDGRDGQGGQGPPPRVQRGLAGDAAPRARRPPDHRAADRVLPVDPRPRGRDPADLPRAGHRLRRLLAARPRLPVGALQVARRARRERLPPPWAALPGRGARAQPGARGKVEELAAEKGCTPGQLALAWVLAQGDDVVPIPGPSAARISRRTSRRPTSSCPRTTSRASTPRCPTAAGDRYDARG